MITQEPQPVAFTVKEILNVVPISRGTLYRAIRDGSFPHVRVGQAKRGRILIPTSALLRWLETEGLKSVKTEASPDAA